MLWLSDGAAADLLTSVSTGTGGNVIFTYQPLTNTAIYTKDTNALDPILDLQGAIRVISKVDVANGVGGTLSTSYAYAGAKANQNGRGFLGFRQVTVTDLQTNLVHTTTYRQDYPFESLAVKETRQLGAVKLNTTTNAYGATSLGGTRYQVFMIQSQASSADLDGSTLPTMTSTYQFDAYGNATQVAVSATDGHAKTTTNTYANDTTAWLLGRLTSAAVASEITIAAPPPAPVPIRALISESAFNLNLWNYLLANGLATAGTPGSWVVTIASGVVVGSTSTALPAFDTGAFPSGSSLQVINNGTIAGAGGAGGNGATCKLGSPIAATAGGPGGAAIRALSAVSVTNNGAIWGGGGGGGGGGGRIDPSPSGTVGNGGGGGGGAGLVVGPGGTAGLSASPGNPGTKSSRGLGGAGVAGGESGGNGGDPGQAGSAGAVATPVCGSSAASGAAGASVIGNSFITWTTVGDRRGPLN